MVASGPAATVVVIPQIATLPANNQNAGFRAPSASPSNAARKPVLGGHFGDDGKKYQLTGRAGCGEDAGDQPALLVEPSVATVSL